MARKKQSVYTYAQLQKMQALPHENKLNIARRFIRDTFKRGKKVALAFSGGKDSVADDSVIYVRINGVIHMTTPAELLGLITYKQLMERDGQFYVIPNEWVEILTASTTNHATAESQFAPISYIMYHDIEAQLYEFTLHTGRKVCTTADHSVLRGRRQQQNCNRGWSVEPVPASSIKVGDMMMSVGNYGFEGREVDIPDWLLRFAGLWVADGCYALDRKIIISTGNFQPVIEFLLNLPRPLNKTEQAESLYRQVRGQYTSQEDAIKYVSQKLGVSRSCVLNNIYRCHIDHGSFIRCRIEENGDVWLCNKNLVTWMRELGLDGKCHEKQVPKWLYTASRRQVGLFLAGYFDGDGHIGKRMIQCSGVNYKLLLGIRELLWRLGIDHGFGVLKRKIGGYRTSSSVLYTISIVRRQSIRLFQEWVPTFKDNSKCLPKDTGYPLRDFSAHKVDKIQLLPQKRRRVFDFEVPDNHMFIADGILVHNSTMLWDLIRETCPEESKNMIVIFGNTGVEYKESLDFARKLGKEWGGDNFYETKLDRIKVPRLKYEAQKEVWALIEERGEVGRYLNKKGRLLSTDKLNEVVTPEMWEEFRRRKLVWEAGTQISFWFIAEQYGFPILGKDATKLDAPRININIFLKYSAEQSEGNKEYYDMIRQFPDMRISHSCCVFIKEQPSQKLQKKLGCDTLFRGLLASESRRRTFTFLDYGFLYQTAGGYLYSNPLSIFTDKDIWQYIRSRSCPYSELYDLVDDKGNKLFERNGCYTCGTGLAYEGNNIEILRKYYPVKWRRLM